jgi:hypothetical protein
MDLHPTHSCFDDAFELIEQLIIKNQQHRDELKNELVLVHAICKMPDGKLYAHAWVEDAKKDTCLFRGIMEGQSDYYMADRKEYYEHIMPKEITKYTVLAAIEYNKKFGTLGPWKSVYKALCRNFMP